MKKLFKSIIIIITLLVIINPLSAQELKEKYKVRSNNNGEVTLTDKEKPGLRYRPSYSEDTRIAVKLNGLLAILIVNPAVEFKVMRNWTVQVEGIGSFYTRNFLGTNKPFLIGATFGEFRYYFKRAFDGLYVAPNIGFSVFKLNKGLVLRYHEEYKGNCYQQGSNVMAGITIGYQYNINKHWSIEVNVAGGFSQAVYDGYRFNDELGEYVSYTTRDASAEWPPIYKGGIFVGYRF